MLLLINLACTLPTYKHLVCLMSSTNTTVSFLYFLTILNFRLKAFLNHINQAMNHHRVALRLRKTAWQRPHAVTTKTKRQVARVAVHAAEVPLKFVALMQAPTLMKELIGHPMTWVQHCEV